MRKYVKTLVYSGAEITRCGNHAVTREPKSARFLDDRTGKEVEIKNPSRLPLRVFTYHDNVICVVSDSVNEFWLSHAGWWTSSTTQALNQYRTYFENWGYHCMTD